MPALYGAQNLVMTVLSFAAFAVIVWALVDCLRTREDAFPAAGKRTKQFWLILTGIAAAIGFIHLGRNPLGLLNIAAFVAAAVYLTDVRPAVRSAIGRGQGGQGTHMGPYGPW